MNAALRNYKPVTRPGGQFVAVTRRLPNDSRLQTQIALEVPLEPCTDTRQPPVTRVGDFASLNHNDLDLVGRQGPTPVTDDSAFLGAPSLGVTGEIAAERYADPQQDDRIPEKQPGKDGPEYPRQ